MSAHTPPVKWAQRKDSIFLTIDIPDAKDATITLTANNLVFKGTSEGQEFALDMEFFKPVDPEHEGSKYTVRPRDVHFHIMKAEAEDEHWPRLLKDKRAAKRFVKTDWSRYVDEDEEKDGFDTSHMGDGAMNFGGAGGPPGGPGGPGGPGAGGFDMAQLQQMMAGMGGGGGGGMPGMPDMSAMAGMAGMPGMPDMDGPADEGDSDDSDDALPDLEPDTEDAGNLN